MSFVMGYLHLHCGEEQKNGGKLKSINFRCKDDSWEDFGMKEILKKIPEDKIKKLYISKDMDAYMQMFLRDYSLRPSCYACVAKDIKMSDITIADFWGIDNIAPEMNDGRGTSLALIRTNWGKHIFKIISQQMKLKEVSYEDGVRSNPAEYKSALRPAERDIFFDDMRNMEFENLEKKYVILSDLSFKSRIKEKIKMIIKHMFEIGGAKSNIDYGLLFVFYV